MSYNQLKSDNINETNNHSVTKWSSEIIHTFSKMNKAKNQAKKAFTTLIKYINDKNIILSDDNKNRIQMLIGAWNNSNLFELDDFILIVEEHTNNFDSSEIKDDEYLNKVWKIYCAFTNETLKSTKDINKVYSENKDRIK